MMGQEAFWSGSEVQLQARQAPGQMDVWDMLENTTDEHDEPTCVECGSPSIWTTVKGRPYCYNCLVCAP